MVNSNTASHNHSDWITYCGFSRRAWSRMNESERLSLLQAVADKQANGRYAVSVSFADMDCATAGYQMGNNIYLNRDMFVNDRLLYVDNDRAIEYSPPDSNWKALETVLHEGRHVFQDMVSKGVVEAPPEMKETFDANGFTVSDVDGHRGSQYMLGKNSYAMYYLNPTELDAYKFSQDKTEQIIHDLKANHLNDPSTDIYLDGLAHNGYEAQLRAFAQEYGNDHIAENVEQALKNSYYGTKVAVDKKIETAVKKEMIDSQKEIDMKESRTMSKETYQANGFTYTVDQNGTIIADGPVDANNGVTCGTRVTPDGMRGTDQRGHVIAAREGGVNKDFNMTAQDAKLNQGAYKTVEKAEVSLAKQGYDVHTSKTAYVSSQQGGRPDAYMISDTITAPDGKTQSVHLSFQNMSPQEQQEMSEQSADAFAQMSSAYPNPGSRPENMSEHEYSELMHETEQSLPSVREEFDTNNSAEMSFSNSFVDHAQSTYVSETDSGSAQGESGIGTAVGASADTGASSAVGSGADGGTDNSTSNGME